MYHAFPKDRKDKKPRHDRGFFVLLAFATLKTGRQMRHLSQLPPLGYHLTLQHGCDIFGQAREEIQSGTRLDFVDTDQKLIQRFIAAYILRHDKSQRHWLLGGHHHDLVERLGNFNQPNPVGHTINKAFGEYRTGDDLHHPEALDKAIHHHLLQTLPQPPVKVRSLGTHVAHIEGVALGLRTMHSGDGIVGRQMATVVTTTGIMIGTHRPQSTPVTLKVRTRPCSGILYLVQLITDPERIDPHIRPTYQEALIAQHAMKCQWRQALPSGCSHPAQLIAVLLLLGVPKTATDGDKDESNGKATRT